MRTIVLAVGRTQPPYADDVQHYQKLLARRIPERAYVCLLDSHGTAYGSEAFAAWLEERRQAGRDVCFVIGGPRGVSLEQCDLKLSLGAMTLPHQLARVVLLEQLYRAHKILAGQPYHY